MRNVKTWWIYGDGSEIVEIYKDARTSLFTWFYSLLQKGSSLLAHGATRRRTRIYRDDALDAFAVTRRIVPASSRLDADMQCARHRRGDGILPARH